MGLTENRLGLVDRLLASACDPGSPRTAVLGYFQPSLTGLSLALMSNPGLRPGLLSAVPTDWVRQWRSHADSKALN